ncbi:hypothetical protein E1B28_000441 [Marasmius oreades]|uniref:GST N-terminal domain-containing protein n=1 Tax=Marasmius oreades TaxID=181124 RepID=A0A9P7V1H4_9AGAR|nr:uncharacterized protein E1B28_000441 [Marasmius oreades]KAG7098497.1 hypothetical protein E1B28_000441 [Marasmius oreades]
MSKPTLYTFGASVWSAAAELVVAELFQPGAVDTKVVNLLKGENFDPAFVNLNPNATLPTLEADGKAYNTTQDVVAHLIKLSGKNVKGGSSFIQKIHEDQIDPNFSLLLARNDEEKKAKGDLIVTEFLSGRQDALERFSKTPEAAALKESFYAPRITGNGGLLAIYKGEASEDAKKGYYATSDKHYNTVGAFIHDELPKHLSESGFIGGSQPGEDDYHLAAWITRTAATVGAKTGEDGLPAFEKAYGKPLPAKVASYWKAWSSRPSFKTVYAEGLH